MKAIAVTSYGPAENLQAMDVNEPSQPVGRELLVQVKAMSVNPIDVKVRGGVYDDAHDFYEKVPKPYHIIGPDGAGVVLATGPNVQYFKPGDEVYFGAVPIRHGAAAEKCVVDERMVAHKPAKWDFVESASLIVSFGTAYESMMRRMEIKKGEQAGILIINGAGGVGSAATQLARNVLKLPVVVTTASRPETIAWSKQMGATHVVNHREDLKTQIDALDLKVPISLVVYFLRSS